MATIAFDSSDAQDASKPPISLHPAFPAIVALWFAALLGIGSLVLPVALLERFFTLTGLTDPPIGFLTRGLVALGAALAGAVAGVVIARRVARAHDERPARVAKFATGARRPISVNEELGGERLVNGRALPVTRRRALAIAEDERPSDYLYMAPLPGHDEDEHEIAFDTVPPVSQEIEPLELCEPLADQAETFFDQTEPPLPDEDEPMTFKQEFQPSAPISFGRKAEAGPAEVDENEPLPFAAPSLARRAAQVESEDPFVSPQPAAEPEVTAEVAPELAPEPTPEPTAEPRLRGDWAEAPVTDLGLVQLVQRLGASLERRREWVVSAAPAAPAPVLVPPAGFDAAPAEEAAQAMAAYFGKPSAAAPFADAGFDEKADAEPIMPPAPFAAAEPTSGSPRPGLLRPWQAEDDEDEQDAVPSFTLPLRTAVVPTIAFEQRGQPAEEEEDADESDDSYSSLLAMRNPFTLKDSGFVRIDEPEPEADVVEPTVVFPGRKDQPAFGEVAPEQRMFDPPGNPVAQPAAAPQPAGAEADAALRAALATLQRMSGSA